jgi:hypothetical protein
MDELGALGGETAGSRILDQRIRAAVFAVFVCATSSCGGGSDGIEPPRALVLLADEDGGSRLLRSDNGGASWSEPLPLPPEAALSAVAFRTRERGFGVTPRGEVLATSNGGDSWTSVLPPSLDDNFDDGTGAIAVSQKGYVVVGGQVAVSDSPFYPPSPFVIVSDDDGATWATRSLAAEIGFALSVCATDDGSMLTAFSRWIGGASGRLVHRFAVLRPGGDAFSVTRVPGIGFWSAASACIGERQFWIAGFDQRNISAPSLSTVWTSADAGLTWEDRSASIPEDAHLLDVSFSDPQHGWLSSASALYRTADGGGTWTPIPLPVESLQYDRTRILTTSPSDVAVLVLRNRDDAVLSTSADAGLTWRSFSIPESSGGVLSWSVRR